MFSSSLPVRSRRRWRSPRKPGPSVDETGVLPPMLDALLTATDPATKEVTWGAFVERYTPLLLRTAYRFAHSYDGAMDRYAYLLEQLSRNDYRRLRAFAAVGPGQFTTWLVVVARRSLLDYHRHRYGRARPLPADDGDKARVRAVMRMRLAEMVAEELDAGAIGDLSNDPEGSACATECGEALEGAVSALEPRDQLLLKLRFGRELPAREIADLMGFPTQFHVYRRLDVVLAVLRQMVPAAYREYVGAIP